MGEDARGAGAKQNSADLAEKKLAKRYSNLQPTYKQDPSEHVFQEVLKFMELNQGALPQDSKQKSRAAESRLARTFRWHADKSDLTHKALGLLATIREKGCNQDGRAKKERTRSALERLEHQLGGEVLDWCRSNPRANQRPVLPELQKRAGPG